MTCTIRFGYIKLKIDLTIKAFQLDHYWSSWKAFCFAQTNFDFLTIKE